MTTDQLYRNLVATTLKRWASDIESGQCKMAADEMVDLVSHVAAEEMSKEDAAHYLNMQRSNFDTKIANGEAPHGRKVRGFKELRWYRPELDASVTLMHRHRKPNDGREQ